MYYKDDKRLFNKLLDRAEKRYGQVLSFRLPTPEEQRAEEERRDWLAEQAKAEEAARAERRKAREVKAAERAVVVTVYCVRCAAPHQGTRSELAKWRKCAACQASKVKDAAKKFCRQCAAPMHREDYSKVRCSWNTRATCAACEAKSNKDNKDNNNNDNNE